MSCNFSSRYSDPLCETLIKRPVNVVRAQWMLPAMVRYKWCKVLCGEKYELYNQGQMHRCHIFFLYLLYTHVETKKHNYFNLFRVFFVRENSLCAQDSVSVVHLVTFQVKLWFIFQLQSGGSGVELKSERLASFACAPLKGEGMGEIFRIIIILSTARILCWIALNTLFMVKEREI